MRGDPKRSRVIARGGAIVFAVTVAAKWFEADLIAGATAKIFACVVKVVFVGFNAYACEEPDLSGPRPDGVVVCGFEGGLSNPHVIGELQCFI